MGAVAILLRDPNSPNLCVMQWNQADSKGQTQQRNRGLGSRRLWGLEDSVQIPN